MGTAGMATRAAMVQHQARRDNMADVAAKDNSQVERERERERGCELRESVFAGDSCEPGRAASEPLALPACGKQPQVNLSLSLTPS